jgi:mono/diheme cytochrome c family protein
MLGNLILLIGLALAAAGLAWAAWRALRTGQGLLKWGGLGLGGLLAAISLTGFIGYGKFTAKREAPLPSLQVAGTAEQVARGEHIANVFCASCHSPTNDLPLVGGLDLGKDLPLPLGSFTSVNLTPGGPLAEWSDGQIFRAIRNGVDPDGKVLFVMSGARGRHLSDDDAQAVIAYLRSQPAVDNPTPVPPDQPSLLGLVMMGAGLIPEGEPVITTAITAPVKGPTAEYGAYLLSYQDCVLCHGEDLKGGTPGQLSPVGPSLRHVADWTPEQFINTLRTGVSVDGHALNPPMPWRNIGRMDDDELQAVYAYITSLPE